jgi:hypothetical protein
MSAQIKFDGYDFTVTTLTEFGVVTPLSFEIQETENGIIATTLINDHNYDHWRGVNALYRELREKLPSQVALSGEYVNEMVAHLYPLCGYFPLKRPAIQRSLYMPFMRAFNYGMPPEPTQESLLYDAFGRNEWKAEKFYENLQMAEEAGLMPTLLIGKQDINLDSDEAAAVFAAARRFKERLNKTGE